MSYRHIYKKGCLLMKTILKLLMILALAAIFGGIFIACEDCSHEWSEWRVMSTPNCTSTGERSRECLKCWEFYVETMPKAHNWGEWAVASAPSCTTAGIGIRKCTLCDTTDSNTAIPPAHKWGAWAAATPATCLTAGVGIRACSVCNAADPDTVIPAMGHEWEWVELAPFSETDDGLEERVCKNDLNHSERRILYATGTEGLAFTRRGYNSYSVKAGTVTDGEVHIPAFYRPNADSEYLPVIEIGYGSDTSFDGGFKNLGISAVYFLAPSNIRSIHFCAFASCYKLTEITLPEGLTYISNQAFINSGLTLITLPESLTYIRGQTFYGCSKLMKITLPAGLTSIGSSAFYRCTSLTEITLPASLTSIYGNPFEGSSIVFTVTTGNSNFSVIHGGKGLVQNNTHLVAYPTASGVITLPTELTSIGEFAFSNCTGLTEITLPTALTSIDRYAFWGNRLTSVTFMGIITADNFNVDAFYNNIPNDLRDKYLVGGPGTYTRPAAWSNTWTKQ